MITFLRNYLYIYINFDSKGSGYHNFVNYIHFFLHLDYIHLIQRAQIELCFLSDLPPSSSPSILLCFNGIKRKIFDYITHLQ
jgi:hypothetical protein